MKANRETRSTANTSSTPKPSGSGGSGGHQSNKLEVTVIPVDDEPFSKTIIIPSSMIGKFLNYRSNLIEILIFYFCFRPNLIVLLKWNKRVCPNTFIDKYECIIIISIP